MADPKLQSLLQAAGNDIGNNRGLYTLLQAIAADMPNPNFAGIIPPMSRILFVDRNTTHAVAQQDGSVANPYATITAALAAVTAGALAGAVIVIGPGIYAENITWPAVDGVKLLGENSTTTLITGSGAGNTVTINAGLAISNCALQGLTLQANAGGEAIVVTGTTNTSLAGGLVLDDVLINNSGATAATFTAVGSLIMNRVVGGGGVIQLLTVGQAICTSCRFFSLTSSWDNALVVKPLIGRLGHTLRDCTVIGNLTVSRQTLLTVESDCVIDDVASATLDVAGGQALELHFYGQQGNPGTPGAFGLNLATAAVTPSTVDLKNARIYAQATVDCPGGTQPLDARGASFFAASPGLTTTGAGVINADFRGADFLGVTFAAGHTLDRDSIRIAAPGIAYAAGANAIAFTPPLPAAATYVVTMGETKATTAFVDLAWVTAQAATGFTLNVGLAGTSQVALLVTRI